MSQENVEIVRAGFDAFNRGDDDAWIANSAEDVEIHEIDEIPDRTVYRGRDGVRAWLANVRSVVEDVHFEPHRFITGDQVVVAEVQASGVGVGSSVPIQWTVYIVFRFRDQELVWAKGFFDRGAALEAAGVKE
jgi:ketosteroid isomerase-like protein